MKAKTTVVKHDRGKGKRNRRDAGERNSRDAGKRNNGETDKRKTYAPWMKYVLEHSVSN
jgi:hypothetical protein